MNDLEKYFNNNTGRQLHKWKHYFEVYERHFSRFRGTDVVMIEFGISQGGSLEMWRDYFGPKAMIYGVDINPDCKQFEDERTKVFIGNQEDPAFLKSIADQVDHIDILLDDGGHTMSQQIATFEALFDHIQPHGVYLCEDLHTSYWARWDGGYKRKSSYIEYSKNFIDYIHAWHSKTPNLQVNNFTRSAHSLHYYDSILVVEKRPMNEPIDLISGSEATTTINFHIPSEKLSLRLRRRLGMKIERIRGNRGIYKKLKRRMTYYLTGE